MDSTNNNNTTINNSLSPADSQQLRRIKLLSADNLLLDANDLIIKHSLVLRNIMVDAPIQVTEIPVPTVQSTHLQLVIDWLTHHVNDMFDEFDPIIDDLPVVSDWDLALVENLGKDDLFQLLLAANYLDIKPLVDLVCRHIASLIADKSVGEMRHFLGVVVSPEEHDMILKENAWVFE